MEKMWKKKLISLFLAAMMLLCIAPFEGMQAEAASFNDINASEVFLKQPKNSVTCTLYAATMMMRRTAIAAGNQNWRNITPSNVSSVAWYSGGLYYNFSYAGISVGHAYVNQNDIKGSYISLLKAYPQGVVAYNRGQPHAILLTDYDANTDTFYCADPSPYFASGRIPLSQSSITGSNQYDKLNRMTDYWYVKSPSVSLQNPAFSNPQNIGNDFYAKIIKNDGWSILAPVNGKVKVVKEVHDASEFWHFVRQSDNSYVIYNCKSGYALDVYNSEQTDGTEVLEYQYHNSDNQKWFIYGRWSGEYVLKPKHCDKVLDVFSNENKVGTKVELWSYNQNNAQKFAIIKYDKVGSTTLSVTPGNSETKTTFKWSKAANATLYNLKIMTGASGNLKFYKTIWGLTDTSCSITLPAGRYEVYVDACTVYHCKKSNVVTFDVAQAVHIHNYTSKITSTATCTKDGVKKFTCSCGDSYTKSISALGHTAVTDKAVAATCTKAGKTKGTHCSVCGEVLTAQKTVSALGHTYKTTTTKATSSKNGKIVTACTACGEIKKTTVIYKASSIKLSKTAYTYNGKAQKPTVTVKTSKGAKLKEGRDYTVKYQSGIKTPGKYTVTITFKGNYSGKKTLTFTIAPKAPTLKVKAGAKKAVLSWNKQTGASGYTVYMAMSKNGTYKKLTTLKGRLSYTKTGLTKGKTYYFKVAAYTVSGRKTITGAYSSVKSVKVK